MYYNVNITIYINIFFNKMDNNKPIKKRSLGHKLRGNKLFVENVVSPNKPFKIESFKKCLQTYTFICFENEIGLKVVFIHNIADDFFSDNASYNYDYVKKLKVMNIMKCDEDFFNEFKGSKRLFSEKIIEPKK